MSDLVSKQDVFNTLKKVGLCAMSAYLFEKIWASIEALPSAEPEERTAKVEVVEKPNVYKCSECGQYFHRTSWGSPVDYCSRCGALLDWSGNE